MSSKYNLYIAILSKFAMNSLCKTIDKRNFGKYNVITFSYFNFIFSFKFLSSFYKVTLFKVKISIFGIVQKIK